MKEANGTVLDNTCLMFLSNKWIGRKHDNFRLPLVLAGGLGGTLQTRRTLNYLRDSEDDRRQEPVGDKLSGTDSLTPIRNAVQFRELLNSWEELRSR
jgi:hypothetical protein